MPSSHNNEKHSKTPPYLLYGVCFAVISAAVGGSLYVYDQKQKSYQAQQEQIRLENAEKEKQKAEMQVLSDKYLKEFVADLKKQSASYKKQKRVLKEIISPYNFETPEYSKENYNLFMNEIAPSLRSQSNAIINVFEQYTEKLAEDIKGNDDELQVQFMNDWNDMSADQLGQYIDFFSQEEKLLQAYEDLIRFYYIHSNLFTVDIEKNVFEFKRTKDKIKQAELLKRIKSLQFRPQAAPDKEETEKTNVPPPPQKTAQ